MKLIKKEVIGDKTVLTVEETNLLFFKKLVQYGTSGTIIPNKYWQWVKLPDMLNVPDRISFQLDTWNRESNKKG